VVAAAAAAKVAVDFLGKGGGTAIVRDTAPDVNIFCFDAEESFAVFLEDNDVFKSTDFLLVVDIVGIVLVVVSARWNLAAASPAVMDAAVMDAAVMDAAVMGAVVTGGAVIGGAVIGGAVTGAAVVEAVVFAVGAFVVGAFAIISVVVVVVVVVVELDVSTFSGSCKASSSCFRKF
jgi:hypothetical protein